MSDLGNLSECILDGSAGEMGGARRLRSKALVASLCLQVVAVMGLLSWPLITLGVLPAQLVVTPLPPFHSVRNPHPSTPHTTTHPVLIHTVISDTSLHQPLMIPRHTVETGGPPPLDADLGEDSQPGLETWIPGGGTPHLRRPDSAASNNSPRMISRGVMDASLVRRVQPDYPAMAKAIHLSGTVVLRAIIGTDGSVRQLRVVSGNPTLAEAALAAVRQWHYRATELNGAPVEVETNITVNFVFE